MVVKHKKLDQRGILHHVLLVGLLFVIVFAIFGTYEIISSHAATNLDSIVGIDSKCLDNANNKKVAVNKIQLYSCNGTPAQSWTVNGTATTAAAVVNSNGYCLDVYYARTANFSKVDLYPCNGTVAQQWTYNSATGQFINPHSGKCLDDYYGRTTNGNKIEIYQCNKSAAQKWTVHVNATTSPASPTNVLSSVFPIGVWQQPTGNFELWKSRGINTMVDVPEGNSETTWNAAAISDGLYEIRAPASNPSTDVGNKNLIAWDQPDEPDGITSQIPYATIQSNYRTWKKAGSNLPVLINFIGAFNQYDLTTHESGIPWYQKYAAGADWISADQYPINQGEGNDLGLIGTELATINKISATKPAFVFIESGNYAPNDGYPTITAAQFNGEVWEAVIHGARGIFYFPQQIKPSFAWDSTPSAVAEQMTADDATFNSLAKVLQGPIDPLGISATVSSPMQVAWRSASGRAYFFILNLSNSTEKDETINLSGVGSATSAAVYGENRTVPISNGKITDSFGPYADHIYELNR